MIMKNCKSLTKNLLSKALLLLGILMFLPQAILADNIKDAFKCIAQKDWTCANSLAKQSKNSALQKIVLSQQLRDDTYKGNSFESAIKFISHNPDWPHLNSIRTKAESYINSSTSTKVIFNWFKNNKPITGEGYRNYVYAASKQKLEPAEFAKIVKDGWRYGNFNDAELKKYKKEFGKYLNEKDHILRIDNNLIQERITAARATMGFVDKNYRGSFEAQIALIRKSDNARDLFRKVSPEHYTPGLIYYYLNSRKRDLPSADEIANLVKKVRHQTEFGDKFFFIQNYLAREFIEKKQYKAAYRVISGHFATNASNTSEAEFLAGWIALRNLHKPELAEKHFKKFDSIVGTPVSKARGQYWLGRTALALGNSENAKTYFQEASSKYPYTFYGQAAAMELPKGVYKIPTNINLANHKDDKIIASSDLYRATLLACKFGSISMAQSYLTSAANKARTPQKLYALAYEIDKIGNVHYKVWFGKAAIAKSVFIKNMNYPLPYKVDHLPTESALTYSIIRQESVYDHSAVSYAKAHGLMQIIKPTACETAKSINMHCNISKLTRDINYNMTIGSNYLNSLIEEFNGSYILASAAYNAGPHPVNRWLVTFGDPRTLKNYHDVIDWIEHIPYGQTRTYVQRVLANLQVYRTIIEKNSTLRLSEELLHKRRS